MKLIGWLTALCLIVLGTSEKVSITHLVDPVSALIVLGFTMSCVGMVYPPKQIIAALRTVLSHQGESQPTIETAAEIFGALAQAARVGGVMGAIICVIWVLSVLGETTRVGPAISTLLLTCFYSILLSDLIFQPIAHRLRVDSSNDGVR